MTMTASTGGTWDAFAAFYDEFTGHIDYDEWMSALEGFAREHGVSGRRLLDVACGTGKSFLPFLGRGYDVVGTDISPKMLEVADARTGGRVELVRRDMRELGRLGEFDLILLVNDALNYLESDADRAATLRGVAENLAPDGIVVLDLNSLLLYRTMYVSTTVLDSGERFMVWRGQTAPDMPAGGLAQATLEIFEDDGSGAYSRTSVSQSQTHYTPAALETALADAGLEVRAVHGQNMLGQVERGLDESRHFKLVYVIGRSSSPATNTA